MRPRTRSFAFTLAASLVIALCGLGLRQAEALTARLRHFAPSTPTSVAARAALHSRALPLKAAPVALAPAAPLAATTITVNSTAQEVTQTNPMGVANTNCTLGEAILSANTNSDIGGCTRVGAGAPFCIVLEAGQTYTLTERGDANNYYGFNGLPPVTSEIVIQGNGAVIERSNAMNTPSFRLFAVASRSATGATLTTPGNLTLQQVTLSGGLAQGGNGGAATFGGGGGGAGLGGAVFNQGTLRVEQSTLTANTARGGSGGSGGVNTDGEGGGGVYSLATGEETATLGLNSTILADTRNGATDCVSTELFAGFNNDSGTNNLIEKNPNDDPMDDAACPGILVAADPQLGALVNNGGPTATHALAPTSPAVDQGKNLDSLTTDQRGTGFARTVNLPPSNNADGTDIGAYELQTVSTKPGLAGLVTDPLGCTGPNSLVTVTAEVTNPNAAALAATFMATLDPQLQAVPGSCTSTVGTCNVVNASTVTWSDTLGANSSVTITYQARVAAGTPPGANVCVNSTASVGGVAATPAQACTPVNCPSAKLNTFPVTSAPSDQKAGSALVFPYYTSDAAGNFNQSDTLITITNVSNGAATGAGGAPAYDYLHLFFMKDCSPADTFICLTPNGSIQLKASEYDPLTTGYLIAVAVDASGLPVQNNSFIGSAFVRDNAAGVIDSYGAEAFWKYSTGAAPVSGGSATLFFDGMDYDQAPIQLSAPLQDPARADQTLVVASLSGDLGTRLDATAQFGAGAVYRDDEAPASFQPSLGSACFITRPVTNQNFRVVPGTLTSFLKDRSGYIKFNLTSPAVGLLLSRQGVTGAARNRFSGIRTLHKTAVTASVLRLPVFPPFCA